VFGCNSLNIHENSSQSIYQENEKRKQGSIVVPTQRVRSSERQGYPVQGQQRNVNIGENKNA
jgi:hypothetical protein